MNIKDIDLFSENTPLVFSDGTQVYDKSYPATTPATLSQ